MSDLENYKERVLGNYFTKKVYLSDQEYNQLSGAEKKKCTHVDGEREWEYKAKADIPPEEIDGYLALKSFEAQMETRNAVITIKNIVVFVFVMSIIITIVRIYLLIIGY
jgi:hypothetical protein